MRVNGMYTYGGRKGAWRRVRPSSTAGGEKTNQLGLEALQREQGMPRVEENCN